MSHLEHSLPHAPTLFYSNGRYVERNNPVPPQQKSVEELEDQLARTKDYLNVQIAERDQEIKRLKDQVKVLNEICIFYFIFQDISR